MTYTCADFERAAPGDAERPGAVILEPNGWKALVAYATGPAQVYADMADYLAEVGVPAPPRDVRWVLGLPGGLTEDEFWDHVNGAMEPAVDAFVAAQNSPTPGPTPHRRMLDATSAVLSTLYARNDREGTRHPHPDGRWWPRRSA